MLCRICISNPTDIIGFRNIFEENKIITLISKYLNFEPKVEDSISNQICRDCLTILENFDNFVTKIQDAQKVLAKILLADPKEPQPNVKTEFIEIKESTLEPIGKDDLARVKIEPKITPDEEKKTEIGRFDSTVINKPKPEDFADEKDETNSSSSDNCSEFNYAERRRKFKKRFENSLVKIQLDERDEKILNFMKKLDCPRCEKEFKCWYDFKKHSIIEHNVERAFVKCCEKNFFQRQHLLDHIDVHSNPNKNTCDICGRLFPSHKLLYNHKKIHQQTPQKCEICSKIFKSEKVLNSHKETHIPIEERTYKCVDCEKWFATKHKMQLHHRGVHKISFICPNCGRVFKTPENFKKHQEMHNGIVEPKAKCEVCLVWFKNSQILKVHKKNLHNPENIQYNCLHCNKECTTKKALYNHLKYVHTEPTHECTICDKKFVNAIRLKEHMATHTGEALYTCPYCTKTFNSSANYYSHQKKMHPKEYEEKQAMKYQNPNELQ